jgi:hypothetical protein
MRVTEVESELDGLRSELAEARSPRQAAPGPSRAGGASSPSSHDNAAEIEIESLRSHIVSLAVALERSETKRAEAIARLQSERENNARSLKRLSESMKRYYHSVSNGDA